ncbi:MAG: arginine decarboxylase [Gammaproteobacteria bacterium]|nr:MAG: arginine decarboxylase [Gammaproteobacteria bacterium]
MNWSIDLSRERYNLPGWSDGYFDINPQGHLTVRLQAEGETVEVDLFDVAGEIRRSGLNWPVLLRCNGILRQRLDRLINAFDQSREKYAYNGSYRAAYPIKVNQQFSVVNTILEHGGLRAGLEAGSKSELMAVLGLSKPDGLVICNGYKDREYIRLGLIARKLGQPLYLVIEKLSELDQIIQQVRELDVEPLLGVRVRLASISAGNWQNTGGTKSKFGLHAAQVLQLVERLRAENLLDRLQLLHFHLGSQLANLRDIKNGLHEAARFYAELHALGAPVTVFDVGGGLGVDYEGTASHSFCSMNYSLEAYADLVVSEIQGMCAENKLPHPDIVTESGRAMTAHHAVLITNVIDTEPAPGEGFPEPVPDIVPDSVRRLEQLYRRLNQDSAEETLAAVLQAFEDVQQAYCQGYVNLSQRALAEQYYFAILKRLSDALDPGREEQRKLIDDLNQKLTDKVFCNLSVFQSLPDVWAIDQIFPIVPLQRLDEEPDRRAIIEDLTCDSDGRIDYYVDGEGIESSLPLHAVRSGEPYLLGFFMVGAYQEILGDMHNLFGDTDTVNLEVHADGSFSLGEAEHGDRADELLSYVHFDPDRLRAAYRRRIQSAGLPSSEARQFLAELESGLTGYTYHED